jgi:hypothetical protein
MSLFKNAKTVKRRVERILRADERTRERDALLISTYWFYEMPKESRMKLSASEFLELHSKNEFTSSETIRRVRQKLQEEFPELRGNNFKTRKALAVLSKEELKNL